MKDISSNDTFEHVLHHIISYGAHFHNTELFCHATLHCQSIVITYPLSEVKKTNVLSSTPAVLRKSNICPTAQSSSLRESPKCPLILEFVNILLAN